MPETLGTYAAPTLTDSELSLTAAAPRVLSRRRGRVSSSCGPWQQGSSQNDWRMITIREHLGAWRAVVVLWLWPGSLSELVGVFGWFGSRDRRHDRQAVAVGAALLTRHSDEPA
ncbi:hypothetical protein ACXR2U_00900 [Jatrophihabitans sp. YIM 134969]